jgi:hypothetical protein
VRIFLNFLPKGGPTMSDIIITPVISDKKPKKKQHVKKLTPVAAWVHDRGWMADIMPMLADLQRLDPSKFAYATGFITGLHMGVTSNSCRPRLEIIKNRNNLI